MLADVSAWWAALRDLHAQVPWSDWRHFWLSSFTFGRNAVLYFLPLLPILVLLRGRGLRIGILLTGLAFVGYVFGALYLFLWLLTGVVFYALGQWYAGAVERQRFSSGRLAWIAIGLVAGHFLLVEGLGDLKLPAGWNAWLLAQAPWLFPLGTARGLPWEPYWFGGPSLQLFDVLLGRAHDVGAAYVTLRMLSYFFELRRRTIPAERRALLRFLAYLCYTPTLIQGPIERYLDFDNQIETSPFRRTALDWLEGLRRMLIGGAKCIVALAYLFPIMLRLGLVPDHGPPLLYRDPARIPGYGVLFFGVHLQVLALYLAFGGYCDLVIGMSRLVGYRVVENFDRPYLARSLTDMWRRWHISLSFILRDYIYFPLTRRRWNNTVNLLFTFLVCGLWHQFQGPYAVWGLVMGLMVAVNQRWSRWLRDLDRHPQRRGAGLRRRVRRLRPLPQVASWLLTINVFVMSGWICFGGWGALRVIWELIRRPAQWVLGTELPPLR